MRRVVWAGMACLVVVIGIAGYNILRSNVLHGPVNARSLFISVADEAGGGYEDFGHPTCDRTARPREWSCAVADQGGSGGVGYTIRVHNDSSCWDGDGGGSGLPRHISGCVHMAEE